MFRLTALALVSLTASVASAADFPLTDKNTTITFVGAKPEGTHSGGFTTVTGTASASDNNPTNLQITLDIDMNSLYSDNPKLTNHLKSPDFFGVKSNPKAKFVAAKIEKSGDVYKITGNLTMIGKTNEVVIPAKIAIIEGGLSLTSDFIIDRTQWGMVYGKGQIDDNVKLSVRVKTK